MGKYFFTILILASVQVYAFEESRSYEEIVRELNMGQMTTSIDEQAAFGLGDVRLHVAVGAVTSQAKFRSGNGVRTSASLQGAEAVVGIDLFSREWLAEGAIRSFHREKFMSTDIALREFDLRLVHEAKISERTKLRFGGGVAARYLSFGVAPSPTVANEQTTPALVALAGIKYRLFSSFELSSDLSYRSSMVSDTIDRRSLDGAIRIGGSF